MNTTQANIDLLKTIKPGVNYPSFVKVVEAGQKTLEFHLQSYYVGMYCALHIDGLSTPHQTGDHDNKRFVQGLVKDLNKAIGRGAVVEICGIRPCKLTMD